MGKKGPQRVLREMGYQDRKTGKKGGLTDGPFSADRPVAAQPDESTS
jgi:hypothetical protein